METATLYEDRIYPVELYTRSQLSKVSWLMIALAAIPIETKKKENELDRWRNVDVWLSSFLLYTKSSVVEYPAAIGPGNKRKWTVLSWEYSVEHTLNLPVATRTLAS